MPVTVTPTPASNSYIANASLDTVENRVEQVAPITTSTAVALGVVSTANWLFTLPFIQKTAYTAQVVVSTTFNSNTPNQFVVSKVVASQPIVLKSFTQYGQVVPTNITVFGSVNTASQQQSDAVAWTVPVVSDSVV